MRDRGPQSCVRDSATGGVCLPRGGGSTARCGHGGGRSDRCRRSVCAQGRSAARCRGPGGGWRRGGRRRLHRGTRGGSACAAGAAETTPLEETAAAGPLRCGERRVRGGERQRGSHGGGAFVPWGPNKGAAGPDRAEPGGAAACAVPGAGGGARRRGSGPRGERPPPGSERKESGDPQLAGSGCGKGCEAGRACEPCP